jgi:hypothetical protein
MIGFTYTDSRTEAMTYYISSGGQCNSSAAERSVAANPIVRQARLIATQPIFYNAFGQNTWAGPVVADNGKFQTLALVATASPAEAAFAEYRSFAGDRTAGGSPAERNLGGTMDRFADRAFSAADTGDPDLLRARAGGLLSVRDLRDDSISR